MAPGRAGDAGSTHGRTQLAAEMAGKDDLVATDGREGLGRLVGEGGGKEGHRERGQRRQLGGLKALEALGPQGVGAGLDHQPGFFPGSRRFRDNGHAVGAGRDLLRDGRGGAGGEPETFLPGGVC